MGLTLSIDSHLRRRPVQAPVLETSKGRQRPDRRPVPDPPTSRARSHPREAALLPGQRDRQLGAQQSWRRRRRTRAATHGRRYAPAQQCELAHALIGTGVAWPELLGALFQASQSQDPAQRENAFRIFSTTPQIIEKQHEDVVVTAFKGGFADSETSVRSLAPIEDSRLTHG